MESFSFLLRGVGWGGRYRGNVQLKREGGQEKGGLTREGKTKRML